MNTKILLIVAAAFIGMVITSCGGETKSNSPVLKEEITKSNLISLTQSVTSDSGITDQDKLDFAQGLSFLSTSLDTIVGKSVGDVIAHSKAKKLELSNNTAENIATKFEARNLSGAKLTGFQPVANANGRQNNQLSMEFYNLSDQVMTRMTGVLKMFNTTNNALVKQYPMAMTQNIEPNKGIKQNISFLHDSTNNRDRFVRTNLTTKMIRWEWVADTLAFEDGKLVTLPRSL